MFFLLSIYLRDLFYKFELLFKLSLLVICLPGEEIFFSHFAYKSYIYAFCLKFINLPFFFFMSFVFLILPVPLFSGR